MTKTSNDCADKRDGPDRELHPGRLHPYRGFAKVLVLAMLYAMFALSGPRLAVLAGAPASDVRIVEWMSIAALLAVGVLLMVMGGLLLVSGFRSRNN